MQIGDITVYTDRHGHQTVGVVCVVHDDGTVDLKQVRPDTFRVQRSSRERRPDTVYDPLLREAALEDMARVADESLVRKQEREMAEGQVTGAARTVVEEPEQE